MKDYLIIIAIAFLVICSFAFDRGNRGIPADGNDLCVTAYNC